MAKVYRRYGDNNTKLSVKEMPLTFGDFTNGIYVYEESVIEAVALRRLADCNSPNIVKVHNIEVDKEASTISFVERCMDPIPKVIESYELRKQYVKDIFEGLYGMHRAGVIHRDIKMENLMVDPLTGKVCFIDFGLATLDPPTQYVQRVSDMYTMYCRCPEILLKYSRYDWEKAEVWAAGVCAASIILNRRDLFCGATRTNVLSNIIGAFKNPCPTWNDTPYWETFYESWDGPTWEGPPLLDMLSHNPLARDFISRCLKLNPDERWTVSDLLQHNFIKGEMSGDLPIEVPIHRCDLDPDITKSFLDSYREGPKPMLHKVKQIVKGMEGCVVGYTDRTSVTTDRSKYAYPSTG